MNFLLSITFTYPAVLGALILLPVIWWLLRLTPPRPREVHFPPTRLLLDIKKKEETPIRSPWWLTVLRLLMAAIVIIALAGPIFRPSAGSNFSASGPIWLLIDNGWASAHKWTEKNSVAEGILTQAEGNGSPVVLGALADGANQPLFPEDIQSTRERLRALSPRPWISSAVDLTENLKISAESVAPDAVFLLTSGLGGPGMDSFAQSLSEIAGSAKIMVYENSEAIIGLKEAKNNADRMTISGTRTLADSQVTLNIHAKDQKGLVIGQVPMRFNFGEKNAEAQFDLPIELRNEINRIEIATEETAGAVQLADERWRRRSVGLLAGGAFDLSQPLLSPIFYLEKALLPFADVRVPRDADLASAVPDLIQQNISTIILADIGVIANETREELSSWIDGGGVLVRFAGPRLASGSDDLLPVALRTGDRELGGSLSWQKPQGLGSYSADSPFRDIQLSDEIEIRRQVLAEPDEELPDKTWASLTDGTPLVTASRFGEGWIVLFHVTADTSWSNLPISGTFVELLRHIIAFSSASSGGGNVEGESGKAVLAPYRLFDGYGRLAQPSANVRPIEAGKFNETRPGLEHPPGLYGSEDAFQALNLLNPDSELTQFDPSVIEGDVSLHTYTIEVPLDLRALLFVLATIMLFADAIAVLFLSGGWRLPLFRGGAAVLIFTVIFTSMQDSALAQEESSQIDIDFALRASTQTRLAYVLTGDNSIDETSRLGLAGLTRFLSLRTALEPSEPIGVDINSDELSYFPLLYWPIEPSVPKPSDRAIARVDAYMRNGGSVLFDTRDEASAYSGSSSISISPATASLRQILDGLDIPPLEPVPSDHVLTKTFFLLQEFPGRWAGGPLWVEAQADSSQPSNRPVSSGDGVSPILITSNDFAAAWAVDDSNRYLFPTYPSNPRQREFAFRSGVNIVMYTLTGNYKADQVHVPALLERLGQ